MDEGPSIETLLAQTEERLQLLGCVNQLGKMQRAVVMLRMLDHQPGDDIAARLKTTPGNVAVMLHRAKQRLRVCMVETEVATAKIRRR